MDLKKSISVHLNLGGGQFRHIGIVISPTRYAMESNAPYALPNHPKLLHILSTDTINSQEELECIFNVQLRLILEVRTF